MATLAVLSIVRAGVDSDPANYEACAAGGDVAPNPNGDMYIHVINAAVGAQIVTVNSVKNCDQGEDHDVVVSIPASEERKIGPFPPGRFNNASGQIAITYDAVVTLTIRPFSLS